MTSTFTPNKSLELPGFNDYVDSWNTPVNADFTVIDTALGGVTNLNATAVSGDVTLTSAQYRPIQIVVSGTLTANVRYLIPSSVGGQWTITNSTTGAFTLSVASAAGGSNITLPSGTTIVSCDGTATGMRLSITSSGVARVDSFSGGATGLTPSSATTGAVTLAGTLGVSNGGTGLTAAPASGQLPIGNGTGYTLAQLTAGSGITITNGAGSITIVATAVQPFLAGTIIVFGQTAAPTGWTKITTYDNAALRIVSGSAASGGSVDFTTAFASQSVSGSTNNTTDTGTVGSTTLTTAQIPSHTHSFPTSGCFGGQAITPTLGSDPIPGVSSATGGGGSHNHSLTMNAHNHTFTGTAINLAVKYVDVIFAAKD